jgi:hypothetical protein
MIINTNVDKLMLQEGVEAATKGGEEEGGRVVSAG